MNKLYLDASTVAVINLKGEPKLWKEEERLTELIGGDFSLSRVEDFLYIFSGYKPWLNNGTNSFYQVNLKDFKASLINEDAVFPNQRTLHSMVLIGVKFYLFAGVHGEAVFNDLWTYDLVKNKWSQVSAKGTIPAPRYLHAFGVEGNTFVIWGGADNNGLRDDMFIFNSLTETWTELKSSSESRPLSSKGACLALKSSKFYLYGGFTETHASNELWEYDFGSSDFRLLEYGPVGLAHSSCWIEKEQFYVSLGSTADYGPYTGILSFNISSRAWQVFHKHSESLSDTSQSIQFFMKNWLISLGGQYWKTKVLRLVSILGPGNQYQQLSPQLDIDIYGSASVYFNKSLFIFGGGSALGSTLLSTVGHNLLFEVKLDEICETAKCQVFCSGGTSEIENSCEVCPKGSFSEGLGNSQCTKCKAGTFNENSGSSSSQQCLPCPEGKFNNKDGAESCQDCPEGKSCPIGSVGFIEEERNEECGSIQPPLYNDPDLKQLMIIYQVLASVPVFLTMVVLFLVKQLRKHVVRFDLFDSSHENSQNEYMIKKKTHIGACFSFLFVIAALLMTCSAVLQYFKANVQETKALVTLVVLESETQVFESESFSLEVTFYSYGGTCEEESKCVDATISLAIERIGKKGVSVTCDRLLNNICRIRVSFRQALIHTSAKISLTLTETLSYSGRIQVNLTSSSSIPDQISSVCSIIQPATNSVFVGPVPSKFYFLATPSLFQSESSRWKSESTGFHISEKSSPVAGSQFKIQDLSSVSNLNLQVLIEKSSTGLLTQRKLKQSFLFFTGSLLGTVSGLFGIVGFVMVFFENKVERIIKRDQRSVKQNSIENHESCSKNLDMTS